MSFALDLEELKKRQQNILSHFANATTDLKLNAACEINVFELPRQTLETQTALGVI